jgi:Acetyltransferase (GNAT) family
MISDSHEQPEIRPARPDDFEFAHDLTRSNMEDYVVRHWGAWRRDIYTENYEKARNYVLWLGGARVGYFRFRLEPPLLVLGDLQIAAQRQGRGLGSFVLARLNSFLPQFACAAIRLRVFHDNPPGNFTYARAFKKSDETKRLVSCNEMPNQAMQRTPLLAMRLRANASFASSGGVANLVSR